MKIHLFTVLFLSVFALASCKNEAKPSASGSETQVAEQELKREAVIIDSLNQELDKAETELDQATQALDKALEDLPK